MKRITLRLMAVYAGFFLIWHFVWISSVFYLMGNLDYQIWNYSLISIAVWLTATVLGLVLIYIRIKPVDSLIAFFNRKENIEDDMLVKISKTSLNLPVYLYILYSLSWIISSSALFFFFTSEGLGSTASLSVWVGGIAGLVSCPVIIFGIAGVLVQKPNSVFSLELKKRNLSVKGKHLSIKLKLVVPYVALGVGFCIWLGGLGYYNGWNQIVKEAQYNELDNYNFLRSDLISYSEGKNDENIIIERIREYGRNSKSYFLSDKSGNILYRTGFKIYLTDKEEINAIIKQKITEQEKISFYENIGERVITIIPFSDDYVIGSVIEMKGKNDNLFSYLLWLSVFMAGGLLVALSIGLSISKWMSDSVFNILTNISKKDISNMIGKDSEDELGSLVDDYNSFIGSINDLVMHITDAADRAKEFTLDLSSSIEESSASLGEIQVTIENISKKSEMLDNDIQKSSEQSVEIGNHALNVLDKSNGQASSIEEGSASIEEISSSINNFYTSVEQKMELAGSLEDAADAGKTEMEETANLINKVVGFADIIQDTVNVISSISEQTGMLAMNASIEAAHAGEAGKGFSVVAEEIRKLSEATSENSREISNALKQLISSIYESKEKADATSVKFDSIFKGVNGLIRAMSEIRDALYELSSASNQILAAFNEMKDSGIAVKDAASIMNNMSEDIKKSMINVSSISFDTKQSLSEFTDGLKDIQNAIALVIKSSGKNIESIQSLVELTGKFKTKNTN